MSGKDEGGRMKDERELIQPVGENLFLRVAAILEQARSNVARSVNTNMVLSYWLIGREIVLELQGGDERAAYGKRLLEDLSKRLTARFKTGFSVSNLKNFRQFFLVYPDRIQIRYPAGSELDNPTIGLILCSDKSETVAKYSILSEAKQVFASKYLPFLPTEEELQLELQRERKMIEAVIEESRDIVPGGDAE